MRATAMTLLHKWLEERDKYIEEFNKNNYRTSVNTEAQINLALRQEKMDIGRNLAPWAALLLAQLWLSSNYPSYTPWTVFGLVYVITIVLRWNEKRQQKDRIIRLRKSCAEPTARELEMNFALLDYYSMDDLEREAKDRDEFRWHLMLLERRFYYRYGDKAWKKIPGTGPLSEDDILGI
jgi:hypothetical protein